jgi:hypothetical protein
MWEYDIKSGWVQLVDYEVDLETRDWKIVTGSNGTAWTILNGPALERQKSRIPVPREPEPEVEIAVATQPTSAPEEVVEPEAEPLPEIVDAIVASPGVARITRQFKRDGFAVIRIDQKDVVTEGELHEGRLIRCRVAPPDLDGTLYNAREIEIYQDLTAPDAEEKQWQ